LALAHPFSTVFSNGRQRQVLGDANAEVRFQGRVAATVLVGSGVLEVLPNNTSNNRS